MNGFYGAVVVLSAVCGVAVICAGVASADGPVQLKSRLGNVCLDAGAGGSFAPVIINPCNGTGFQRWNVDPGGRIESVAYPGQCLNEPDDGLTAHLWGCWDSRFWNIQPNGQITAVLGGCLTVLGGTGPGTWVGTRICNGAPEQGWDSVS